MDVKDVTIIIPVYCPTHKSVDWLDECLESAVATGANVVVWNDGSPKVKRVRDVIAKHGLYYHGTVDNHGPGTARNNAVKLVKTRYILPLDNDDIIHPDAVLIMSSLWTGKPLIPDLWKFGDVNKDHYVLLDWSCELQWNILGIASVNVLHSVDQHNTIGGWQDLPLYEDAEYNARLLMSYCGQNVHKPLIGYRQHSSSRLHMANQQEEIAAKMLQKIGDYDMACCGKKKLNPVRLGDIVMSTTVEPSQLADMQGTKVLTRYIGGKGMGRHNSRGVSTRRLHRVKFGEYVYVDPADARDENDVNSKSLFVRVTDGLKEDASTDADPVKSSADVDNGDDVVDSTEVDEKADTQPKKTPVKTTAKRTPAKTTTKKKPATRRRTTKKATKDSDTEESDG